MEGMITYPALCGKEQQLKQDFCLGAKLKTPLDCPAERFLVTGILDYEESFDHQSFEVFPNSNSFGPDDLFKDEALQETTDFNNFVYSSPAIYLVEHKPHPIKENEQPGYSNNLISILACNTPNSDLQTLGYELEELLSESKFEEINESGQAINLIDNCPFVENLGTKVESFLSGSNFYNSVPTIEIVDSDVSIRNLTSHDDDDDMTLIEAIHSNLDEKLDTLLLPDHNDTFMNDVDHDLLSVSSWSSSPGTPYMSPISTDAECLSSFSLASPGQVVPTDSITIITSNESLEATFSPRKIKSRKGLKKKATKLPPERKSERKKQQNKEAALRYREKCKKEKSSIEVQLKEEEERKKELQIKHAALKQELTTMKKIIRELLIANKVVSPNEFH